MLQNGFASDFDHRLRQIGGQFAHPCAATGREQDRFVYFPRCHVEQQRDVASIL